MSVVIETTQGDFTVDLYLKERPKACKNFLKLCKIKYYNFNLFHTIQRNFIAQTGDPTGSGKGGESVFGVLYGAQARYFEGEKTPRLKHTKPGTVSMVNCGDGMLGSQFFITLDENLTYLDGEHCIIGEVVEGFEVLAKINDAICDGAGRPYQDVRISHTVVLEDPFADPAGMIVPSRSPSPTPERMQGGRIAADEEIDDLQGKSIQEIEEIIQQKEAESRATILEMIGDLPEADMAPPENVLFVCKLNSVTTDEDLEIIFSRFGKIKCCEIIRDAKSGESLQYAFIEFEDKKACEDAYFKMDNVLIDDRRIHVDFSQSVSQYKWKGKGRGVDMFDDKGKPTKPSAPWIRKQEGGRPSHSSTDPKNQISSSSGPIDKHKRSRSPPRYSRGHASEQSRTTTASKPSEARLFDMLKKEFEGNKKKPKKSNRRKSSDSSSDS